MHLQAALFLLLGSAVITRCESSSSAEYYLDVRQSNTRRLDTPPALINRQLPAKFIIHGWTETANRTHYVNLSKLLLKYMDCYVFRVDYSSIASQNYLLAATSVGVVGNDVGDFIARLMRANDLDARNVHIIGHSLGSQVAGYVGRRIQELTGVKLARITALDPAALLFENNAEGYKLTKRDASIVDIVHTDGGVLGYSSDQGSVDFYPNGGRRMQPGCYSPDEQQDVYNNMVAYMDAFYCSHHKSYIYYTASIFAQIPARKCSSWRDYQNGLCDQNERILFGARMPENATGSYYFELDLDDEYIEDVLLPKLLSS